MNARNSKEMSAQNRVTASGDPAGPRRFQSQKSSPLFANSAESPLALAPCQSGRGGAAFDSSQEPDLAILRLIRALARDAARQDHEMQRK
jgi:hypothetical protein